MIDYSGDIEITLENGEFSVSVENGDLKRDQSLQTSILISLFCNSQDSLYNEDTLGESRGWWASSDHGSLLWQLNRTKTTTNLAGIAEDFSKKALQWMIDENVASKIDVEATVTSGKLTIKINVIKNGNASPESFQFSVNWKQQLSR